MATVHSQLDRRTRRKAVTIDEALAHAVDIMAEVGVGGLSISEIARRMGMRPPSLYKYFPSLHAVYDELFGRGAEAQFAAVRSALEGVEAGPARVRAAAEAIVRWSIDNPALAQLLFWRPVPGFQPSPQSFAPSVQAMSSAWAEFADAVRLGFLDADADLDEMTALFTVLLSGLISQQLSNETGVDYERGRFSSRTHRAVEMFLAAYTSRR